MTESCPKKTNIAEISPHLICALCGGYLIDATTIVECLHSFCKTCIVRYLESSKYCPICEVLVHKTRPLQNIRLDHTLQDIVYKLVPNLFKEEMKRRREFYKDHPTIRSAKVRQEQQRHRFIYSADEQFSISLEFCPDGCIRRPSTRRSRKRSKHEVPERRYFLCPAGTTVSLLQKFMKLKFALDEKYQVDIFHEKGRLKKHYSLMDIAYIYSWKREGVLQLFYSVFNLPEPAPPIIITEVKADNCLEVTDDTGQRLEDTRPSTLFNKATLLGNHSVDRNIPHDLSPLQLIATVASDICIQEGRGLKRKPEDAQLYENDDDNSSTETCQLQKSIERAIDLCSYSNQGSPARSVVTHTVATATSIVNTSSSVTTSSLVQTYSGGNLVSVESEQNVTEIKNAYDISNGKVSGVVHASSEKKVSTIKDKPKKTDTASQCDPRPKKTKSDGNSGSHSKTTTKAQTCSKDTKTTNNGNKTEKVVGSETRASNKSESLKSNGVSIIEQTGGAVTTSQNKTSDSSGNAPKSRETTAENYATKEPSKDSTSGTTKVSSESNRESNSVTKLPSSLPPSSSVSGSKSNSASVSRHLGSTAKSSSSSSSGKSSNNNSIKTTVSTTPNKPSITQTTARSGSSHNTVTPVPNPDKTTSGQVSNKVLSNSKVSSISQAKSTHSPSKTNDSVKTSTLINGHSNPSEIAKQQTKNSSSAKVKTSDSKE